MKKSLPIGLALIATGAMAANPNVNSAQYNGQLAHSLSDNGKWLVSEMFQERSIMITNLETGKSVAFEFSGGDMDETWDLAFGRSVSDDGIVVGEDWNIPSYLDMTADKPQWVFLDGITRDMGVVAAVVGGITPDGSVIAGSIGNTGFMSFAEKQLTYPCVWRRQADGTYGKVEYLPSAGKDFFGSSPMYVNVNAVSADGKTIAASMRSGAGFNHQPYVAKLGDDGNWTWKALGMELINPKNLEIIKNPGDYNSDSNPSKFPPEPNYENYVDQDQLFKIYGSEGQAWIESMYKKGITDDTEIYLEELLWVMNYMNDEQKAEYEPLARAFVETYGAWYRERKKYEAFLDALADTGVDFVFNNTFLSPDGKYLYASAKSASGGPSGPVRFDTETGEAVVYDRIPGGGGVIISSVAEDYSVMARPDTGDGDAAVMAYIYPGLSTKPVAIIDWLKENDEDAAYTWIEDHCQQTVLISITDEGKEIFDTGWSLGKPVCTPDLKLFAFGTSTLYWEVPLPGMYTTFVLNLDKESGVESVEVESDGSLNILAGGQIEVKGNVNSLVIYDLSGTRVYNLNNPTGIITTGLPSGVYIVNATTPAGNVIKKKALF